MGDEGALPLPILQPATFNAVERESSFQLPYSPGRETMRRRLEGVNLGVEKF